MSQRTESMFQCMSRLQIKVPPLRVRNYIIREELLRYHSVSWNIFVHMRNLYLTKPEMTGYNLDCMAVRSHSRKGLLFAGTNSPIKIK